MLHWICSPTKTRRQPPRKIYGDQAEYSQSTTSLIDHRSEASNRADTETLEQSNSLDGKVLGNRESKDNVTQSLAFDRNELQSSADRERLDTLEQDLTFVLHRLIKGTSVPTLSNLLKRTSLRL